MLDGSELYMRVVIVVQMFVFSVFDFFLFRRLCCAMIEYTLELPPTRDAIVITKMTFYFKDRESQPKPSFVTDGVGGGGGVDRKYLDLPDMLKFLPFGRFFG